MFVSEAIRYKHQFVFLFRLSTYLFAVFSLFLHSINSVQGAFLKKPDFILQSCFYSGGKKQK